MEGSNPSLWFGIQNNERWDLHVGYYVAVRHNVVTGQRRREGFIVTPKVARDLVGEGSYIYRPWWHENKEFPYQQGDEPLRFAPQKDQNITESSSSFLINCNVAQPNENVPQSPIRGDMTYPYLMYMKNHAGKPIIQHGTPSQSPSSPIPFTYSPGYAIGHPKMHYAFSPCPSPLFFTYPRQYPPSTSSTPPVKYETLAPGYSQNQINSQGLSPLPYQGHENISSTSNASFDEDQIPILKPVPHKPKKNIRGAQTKKTSLELKVKVREDRSDIKVDTEDVGDVQILQPPIQNGSPSGEARGEAGDQSQRSESEARSSVDDTPSVDPTPSMDSKPLVNATPSVDSKKPMDATPSVDPKESMDVTPSVDPKKSTDATPSVDPKESTDATPSVDPKESTDATPSVDPKESTDATPSVDPKESTDATPSVDPKESTDATPSVDPKKLMDVTPSVNPKKSTDATPSVDPKKSMDVTPLVNPKKSTDSTPSVDPKKSMDATPPVNSKKSMDATPLVDPKKSMDATPSVDPKTSMDATPSVDPKESMDVTPSVNSKKSTDATPSVDPKESMDATPSVTFKKSMDATTSNGSNIQSAKPSPPSVNPTFPEISAKLMKRETLNAYVSKANKRRQQRKKNKELAAAEDAEFEKMLQEAMEQDKLKQQEEYNDFSNSLQFYIDRHSDYRNKHFALRKHKTENIIGVQQCIVDFYRNRCVFEVASLVESPLVLNFFNAKMMELKGEHDGRIFHLLDSLVPLISSTPIVQQDLYWLYETRNKKSWSENALELYKFILYTPSMITSEIRWFTAQEIETYLPSLENGGYRQYESFARYLNRNIQMRAKKQNNPFGVSQPVCEFEKYINDEYFDCTEVDLKWTRARSKRFANLIVSPFKSSKPEQWRNCSNLFKELVKLESDIIDYDFSKLYGFDEDLELAVIGYCGLLSGTISSDPENWHEDFVLITPTERDSTDPL